MPAEKSPAARAHEELDHLERLLCDEDHPPVVGGHPECKCFGADCCIWHQYVRDAHAALDEALREAEYKGARRVYEAVRDRAKACCSKCEPVSLWTLAVAIDELFPPLKEKNANQDEG